MGPLSTFEIFIACARVVEVAFQLHIANILESLSQLFILWKYVASNNIRNMGYWPGVKSTDGGILAKFFFVYINTQ